MIKQLLDPEFVAARAAELEMDVGRRRRQFANADSKVRAKAEGLGIGEADLEAAREILAGLAAKGDFTKKPEDAAWIPRDPRISLVQSGLEEFYQDAQAVDGIQPPEGQAAGTHGFATFVPAVTGESLKDDWIPSETKPFLRQTEQSDWLGWGLSFAIAKGIKLSRGLAPFPAEPPDPRPLKPKARLILVGDWGSGVPRAEQVAERMKERLHDREALSRERHVIHLGDVYYAGRDYEYDKRFGRFWPVKQEDQGQIKSWCLNGNHDMFTGGHAFFEFLARDKRFESQKGCSYFCLENDDWQIFGLDSAYESDGPRGETGGLQSPQAEWLAAHRQRAPHKKVVLLTHHQLFSSWEENSPLMGRRLDTLLHGPTPVTAWFWGHEHRCAVYGKPSERQDGYHILYPALIGHGGVPVHGPVEPKRGGIRYHYQEYFREGFEKFQRMGFAVLDLDGEHARVQYVNELGQPHCTHPIP